jgi:CRP/FNR family transcriptional regulator, anaerobic regulatory protein
MQTMTRCEACEIRHLGICAALNGTEVLALGQISVRKLVPKGQAILSEGEPGSVFANITSGAVKLSKSLGDGRQHVVGLLFAPDFVGRAFGPNSPYHAEAATDVGLCIFPKDRFERVLRDHPALEHRLFERTLSDLDASREWMLLLARKTAAEKVASFLLMLAKRAPRRCCQLSGKAEAVRIELPLSRYEIADCLGLTFETVSRQMTRLKSSGVIDLLSYREIAIPDMARLANIACA